jgi:hypothetical protein
MLLSKAFGGNAEKYTLPLNVSNLIGVLPSEPGIISATRIVPAVVPSEAQSSFPFTLLSAKK